MSNAWEEYERFYEEKFQQRVINESLEQGMPFKAYAFWIGFIMCAAFLVGGFLHYVMGHVRP